MGGLLIAGAWFGAGHTNASSPFPQANPAVNHEMASQPLQTVSVCPLQPVAAKSGEKDGQFPFQVDLLGLTATEIASFIVIGKEAASSGRLRDAETAFLMSCRVADKLKGAGSLESADSKSLLGGLYARAATDADSGAVANRAELLWRAQLLYSNSLDAYVKKFGKTDNRSQSTARELAAVQQSLTQVQPLQSPDDINMPGQ